MTVPPFRFRPDIEGLRAVAILLVVGHHVRLPLFEGGFVGVDVFFVLSGYLITWLLVREVADTGRIDFARFYARRARRLVPALAVVLAAAGAAAAVLLAPYEQVGFGLSAAISALYGSNLVYAYFQSDYFAGWMQRNPFLHTWSLGVEEQFYLAWPWVVAGATGLLGRARPVVWLGGVTAVSFAASLVLSEHVPTWAFYLSPTRAWQFGAGGLAVLLPMARWETPRVRAGLGWAGLAGLGLATVWFHRSTVYPGLAALLPTVATVVLLRCERTEAGTWLGRLLSLRPMREIGRLSYSWYLWHWPVLVLGVSAFPILGGWRRIPLALGSLGLAWISYHLIEAPARTHPALATPRRAWGATLAVTGLLVALSLGWVQQARAWADHPDQEVFVRTARTPNQPRRDGCVTSTTSAEVRECHYGPPTAPRHAVVVGDSQAASWFALVTPLLDRGDWRVTTLIKVACPFVDHPLYSVFVGRRDTKCEAWRADATARIQAIEPDLVFLGIGTDYAFTPDEWDAGLARTLGTLADASDHVVLLNGLRMPRYDVTACLARRAWRPALVLHCRPADDADGADRRALLSTRADARADVAVFDVTPFLCGPGGCPVEREGRPVYRDATHVALWVAEQAGPAFAATVDSLFAQPAGP